MDPMLRETESALADTSIQERRYLMRAFVMAHDLIPSSTSSFRRILYAFALDLANMETESLEEVERLEQSSSPFTIRGDPTGDASPS